MIGMLCLPSLVRSGTNCRRLLLPAILHPQEGIEGLLSAQQTIESERAS